MSLFSSVMCLRVKKITNAQTTVKTYKRIHPAGERGEKCKGASLFTTRKRGHIFSATQRKHCYSLPLQDRPALQPPESVTSSANGRGNRCVGHLYRSLRSITPLWSHRELSRNPTDLALPQTMVACEPLRLFARSLLDGIVPSRSRVRRRLRDA